MRSVDEIAEVSVARGCGFGSIAIFTFMIGLSDDMALALQAGGLATLLMSVILLFRARAAVTVPVKRTEVWIMMESDERPPAAVAQQVIGAALRQAYLRFATHAAFAAAGMLAASLSMRFIAVFLK